MGPERAERVPLTSLGLLRAADADQPVAHLSIGQRRRLALAIVLADPPELLLLDEPTNHLSPTLCDELEEALLDVDCLEKEAILHADWVEAVSKQASGSAACPFLWFNQGGTKV